MSNCKQLGLALALLCTVASAQIINPGGGTGTGFPFTPTTGASTVGGTAALTPTTTGQVTANGLFLSTAGLNGVPIPTAPIVTTTTLTGGSLIQSNHFKIQMVFSNGTTTSTPSGELDFGINNTFGGTCTSGTACTMTFAAPTFPSGVTSYSVYTGTTAGSEKLNAECSSLTTGVACVMTGIGAGASVPTPPAPVSAPGTLVQDCNSGQIPNPFMWVLKGDGLYHATAGIDNVQDAVTNGPVIGNTLHFCGRVMFDDTGYANGNLNPTRTPGAASAFAFTHASGVNQGAGCCIASKQQDDRVMSVFNYSPVGDASARPGMQIAIYNESGVLGHPNLTQGQGVNPGFTNAAVRSNCYLNSDQANFAANGPWGCHQVQFELDQGHVTGNQNSGMASFFQINAATTTQTLQNNTVSGFLTGMNGGSCTVTCMTSPWVGYNFQPTTGNQPASQIGFWQQNLSNANITGFKSDQDGTAGSLAFNASNAASYSNFGFVQSSNKAAVAADFTSANSASLQAITGLSYALMAKVQTWSFHCSIMYSQATASAGDQFGVALTGTAPTDLSVFGVAYTNTGATPAPATGILSNLTTTTPTAVITFTPAVTTVLGATLDGTVTTAAGGGTLNIYVLNGTAANVIVVKRGSACTIS